MVDFIPRYFRKKNPIVSLKEVIKDQQILTFVKRGLDIHEQYKKDMSKICKDVSRLEIEIRHKNLRAKFYGAVHLYTHASSL